MAKKRTKFDKSQRQASRLEDREEMRPEPPSPEAAWIQPAASELWLSWRNESVSEPMKST